MDPNDTLTVPLIVPAPTVPTVEEAFKSFREEWALLSPLVRASVAEFIAERSAYCKRDHLRSAAYEASVGLRRRVRVTDQFAAGHDLISRFFIALSAEADTEVETKLGGAGLDDGTFRQAL
jgi:hypothetical protein